MIPALWPSLLIGDFEMCRVVLRNVQVTVWKIEGAGLSCF